MRILRLVARVDPTSLPYHQMTLPLLGVHEVTLCSYYRAEIMVDRHLDFVEGNGRLRGFLGSLWSLLRRTKYDVVHVHSAPLAVGLLAVACVAQPSLLLRNVLHVHDSYDALCSKCRWMLLPAFLFFRRVVCCSHSSRRSFPILHRALAGYRLLTICNGADLDYVEQTRIERGMASVERTEPFRLISIGNLCRTRNHEAVLHALAQADAKDVFLTIIGEGNMRSTLATLCRKLDIVDRVHFAGRLSRQQTLQQLWSADAFVSMSRSEGLPVHALEAMACHCPVLLSNIASHREIRAGRKDLIPLLAPNGIADLAGAIDDWCQMPLDVLRCWGADCRLHVERFFPLDRTLAELSVVLEEFDPNAEPTLEWNVFCRSTRSHSRARRAA